MTKSPTMPQMINCLPSFLFSSLSALAINLTTPMINTTRATDMSSGMILLPMIHVPQVKSFPMSSKVLSQDAAEETKGSRKADRVISANFVGKYFFISNLY